jgi:hypothetical protein
MGVRAPIVKNLRDNTNNKEMRGSNKFNRGNFDKRRKSRAETLATSN